MAAEVGAKRRKFDWLEVAETTDFELVREAVARETRGWGGGLMVLGVIQLAGITWGLDPAWGVALLLAGGASFLFRSAAMLPVYGVLVVWAMIGNLLSGTAWWMLFGVAQAYWAFRMFQQFVLLRRVTSQLDVGFGLDSDDRSDRAAAVFPWAGCALTGAAYLGVVAVILGAGIWYAFSQTELSDEAMGMAAIGMVNLAVLGMALAVAALLARYRFRAVSILTVVAGALILGAFVALAVLG